MDAYQSSLFTLPVLFAAIVFVGLLSAVTIIALRHLRRLSFGSGAASRDGEIATVSTECAALSNEVINLRNQLSARSAELAGVSARSEELPILRARNEVISRELADTRELNREIETRLEEQKIKNQEKLQVLEDAKSALTDQFKVLADNILEEKSKKFTDQNQVNLTNLVTPLKEQLREFESKFIDGQNKDIAGRAEIKTEISQLRKLNQQISLEAENLTKALKGDSKSQGTWGELILDKVLESSGLEKGREYETQKSLKTDDSSLPRPDAIVHLPDGKDIIVDSKVSLTAYERFHSASTDEDRAAALAQHVASVRGHINRLSEKSYQNISSIQTLDFVLMFVPVEAALTDALREAPDLFEQALAQNIGLVSPSTLMLTLRTIEHIWRSDRQNKNALEIAQRGGQLYDKFVGFVLDLDKIGGRIRQTQDAYQAATTKLSSGHGSLVRQAELLRTLGAKTTKVLPASLAYDEDLVIEEVMSDE